VQWNSLKSGLTDSLSVWARLRKLGAVTGPAETNCVFLPPSFIHLHQLPWLGHSLPCGSSKYEDQRGVATCTRPIFT
jgi:hypothetical protein